MTAYSNFLSGRQSVPFRFLSSFPAMAIQIFEAGILLLSPAVPRLLTSMLSHPKKPLTTIVRRYQKEGCHSNKGWERRTAISFGNLGKF